MPIVSTNEPDSSNIGNVPVGLYYYYIPRNELYDANYLGYAPTVESVTFNPFLDTDDLNLIQSNFDVDRYGTPSTGIPKCYRIASNPRIEKTLGSVKLFPTIHDVNRSEEPKLFCYPFRYFIITDYVNPPLLIKPELVSSNNNQITIKVITSALTQSGKYNIYVDGYKNDYVGNLEGVINSTSYMLPVSSSAYAQFLATSSNSFTQANANALLENDISLKQGIASNDLSYLQSTTNNIVSGATGLIGGLLTGNFGGALGSLFNSGTNQYFNTLSTDLANSQLNENHDLKESVVCSMANAKISDMLSTPRSLKTVGNDTLFNMINSKSRVDIIEYNPTVQYMTRLRNYFQRYGYAINGYLPIDINSRKYFNYVKTNICNIMGAKIPSKHLEEIKRVFNSGLTFWHVETGIQVGDYSTAILDGSNREV